MLLHDDAYGDDAYDDAYGDDVYDDDADSGAAIVGDTTFIVPQPHLNADPTAADRERARPIARCVNATCCFDLALTLHTPCIHLAVTLALLLVALLRFVLRPFLSSCVCACVGVRGGEWEREGGTRREIHDCDYLHLILVTSQY